MTRLPDPRLSQVVLIGTSRYEDGKLPDLPQVSANLRDLSRVLTDPLYGVVPADHCVTVKDEEDIRRIGRHLRAAQQAEDLLLVYYSGHGLIGGQKHDLYLALRGSEWNDPEFNSLEYDKLRSAVLASPARIKVIVLDCCFSGRVITDTMTDSASEIAGQVEVEGTYVLTSSLRDQVALSLPGEAHTAFTGRLIRVLENGMPHAHQFLTIDDLYLQLFATMRAERLPLPQKRGTGNAQMIALTLNRAYAASPESPQGDRLAPGARPEQRLDWETLIRSLRDLALQQPSTDGPDLRDGADAPGDAVERAAMLRDALTGESPSLGPGRWNTVDSRRLPPGDLQAWGYRDRAAVILWMLYPGPAMRRARRERAAKARREACVDLFQATWELRTYVANNFDYHGPVIGERLAEVRARGRAGQVHALSIAILGPVGLIQPAEQLAAAATRLADSTADSTELDIGLMIRPPDFTGLDSACAEFRQCAMAQAPVIRPERVSADICGASVRLFGAGQELLACITDNSHYRWDEMGERLAQVRARVATGQVEAFHLALLVPAVAEEAGALAAELSRLAAGAEMSTDRAIGVMTQTPDFSELKRCSDNFRRHAIALARRIRAERTASDTGEACTELLRATGDLRTSLAAIDDQLYEPGDVNRLAQARMLAVTAQVAAFSLALTSPPLAQPSADLATEATRLADAALEPRRLRLAVPIQSPDFSELDTLSERLRQSAGVPGQE